MAFTEVQDLGCDKAISLGGRDKKTNKPNPTTVQGYYLGSRDIASKFSKTGFAKMHILSTPTGNVGVYGKTDLDRKIAEVRAGCMVRITQNGSVPTNKGNDMLKFKVEVDTDNTIDVGNLASAPSNDSEAPASETYADDDSGYAYQDDLPVETAPAPRQPARSPAPADKARVQQLLSGRK